MEDNANNGIYSKITNDNDLKIYQIITDLEVATEEEIQKAGHFHTSDLTSGLKRLQSAGLIAFDEWNVGGYYTTPVDLPNMLSSLKSKNWKERYAALRVIGDFLNQETEVNNFDKAVDAIIKVMRTDKHMWVIFETNFSLTPVISSALGQKHKEKVIKACCEVSRKAVEIAVKCGATKVPDSDNPFSDFSVKWGGTANNPRIDVSKCPWEAEVDDKEWENQIYAETLLMIIIWQEI